MRPGLSYPLQAIHDLVEHSVALDSEDLEFDGVSQAKWERNVRNLLQYRIDTGVFERTDRGEYRRLTVPLEHPRASGGSPHVSPWAQRSARYLHGQLMRALSSAVVSSPSERDLQTKPLVLRLAYPLPAAASFYVYLATDHPSSSVRPNERFDPVPGWLCARVRSVRALGCRCSRCWARHSLFQGRTNTRRNSVPCGGGWYIEASAAHEIRREGRARDGHRCACQLPSPGAR
jgi:hypothetical protein